MLVLSRKNKETVRIGDDITITVLEVNGNQIRFGIDAPKHVDVHREEIYKKIQDQVDEPCLDEGGVPTIRIKKRISSELRRGVDAIRKEVIKARE